MNPERHSESAFETVIEAHLRQIGYRSIPDESFDRERAILPGAVLDFVRETQPAKSAKPDARHGDEVGVQAVVDLCKHIGDEAAA